MSRLKRLEPEQTTGATREMLKGIEKNLGLVPNIFRAMANAPAVLDAYLKFSGALAQGRLDGKLRERVALATAQANGCDYCLAAHTALGRLAGLSDEEIADSRRGSSPERRADAALKFVGQLLARRGRVSDAEVERVRAAGFDDGELAELVANVALNILTNYFNLAADTGVDFPAAPPLSPAK